MAYPLMPLVLLQLLYEHSKTCLWCWLHIYWRKWKHWKGLSGWWYMVWYQPDVWRYDGVKIIFSTYFIGTAIICFKCECNSFTISNCTIMYYCSFIVKSCFQQKIVETLQCRKACTVHHRTPPLDQQLNVYVPMVSRDLGMGTQPFQLFAINMVSGQH